MAPAFSPAQLPAQLRHAAEKLRRAPWQSGVATCDWPASGEISVGCGTCDVVESGWVAIHIYAAVDSWIVTGRDGISDQLAVTMSRAVERAAYAADPSELKGTVPPYVCSHLAEFRM